MAWFVNEDTMASLNAIGRDAHNFMRRTIEEIEKDLARVEVNVGTPGLRFGQSRNGNAAGTSEGTSMGSETKGPAKKAMACEGCSTKFSFIRRKRECFECRRFYCTQCLPKTLPVSGSGSSSWCSRERRQTTCSKCLILLAKPPSRSALLGLRTRDLQAFLASRKVATHGCVEKEDLVNLVLQLSTYEPGDSRLGAASPRSTPSDLPQTPINDQLPLNVLDPDLLCQSNIPSPRSDSGGSSPVIELFGSRIEVHSPPPFSQRDGPLPNEEGHRTRNESLFPRLPVTDDSGDGVPVGEEAIRSDPTLLPSSPGSHVVPTREQRPEQPLPPPPLVPDEGDWVMVDVEEHVLPPYSSAPRASPPSSPHLPPPTTEVGPDSPVTGNQEGEAVPTASSRTGPPVTPPTANTEDDSSATDVNSHHSSLQQRGGTIEDEATALPSGEEEGHAQASSASQSPLLSRSMPSSLSQGSSPSKSIPLMATRGDIAYSILTNTTSEDDLAALSVKQLKELLTSSRVDYRGCCEKQELLERAQRLWREHKASQNNLSDDTMCKVCMDACIDCVMLECGHMATCTPCGKRMSECPICRQYVVRIVRTFRA